jgi:hypothetical protein
MRQNAVTTPPENQSILRFAERPDAPPRARVRARGGAVFVVVDGPAVRARPLSSRQQNRTEPLRQLAAPMKASNTGGHHASRTEAADALDRHSTHNVALDASCLVRGGRTIRIDPYNDLRLGSQPGFLLSKGEPPGDWETGGSIFQSVRRNQPTRRFSADVFPRFSCSS